MAFIPKDCQTTVIPNERIALLGPPGAGKTTSLLTFPNLIIGDVDHKCPPGIAAIPMWNPDWADEVLGGKSKRTVSNVPNFRDAIKKWLRENHDKFEPEQTFALDSWTFVQDSCDLQTHVEDDLSGAKNAFWFWGQKLRYSKELMDFLKKMKCRVVVTFHETIDRDETGRPNGKLRPAMDGSYKDVVLGNFTDVIRQRANVPILDDHGKPKRDTKGKVITGGFIWQLAGDSVVDLNTNPTLGAKIRKHGITQVEIKYDGEKVTGGYQEIQKIYSMP